MSRSQVTYRGCVNAWECDQWGHQNVQFYLAKAADAQAALCCEIGLTPSYLRDNGAGVMTVRDRVLFKRELHAGDAVCIRSGIREAHGAAIRYFSVLSNQETGTESAVFETEARLTDVASAKPIELPQSVALRALQLATPHTAHAPPAPIDAPRAPAVTPQHALLTHRGTLQSWECDESGWTTPRFQIARFAESATQLIEHLGLPKAALRSRNLGSAALDYAIEYRAPLRPGQSVDVRSGVLEVGRKVLRCFHHLIDSGQGEIATIIEIAVVFFDLTARKSVAMPPEIVAGARGVMAS
jgi:acyl-CoA thioester hydrolase